MNQFIQTQVSRMSNNPLGAAAGATVGYYAAKKLMKTEKMWIIVAVTVVGASLGATALSKLKAAKGQPTAADAKK